MHQATNADRDTYYQQFLYNWCLPWTTRLDLEWPLRDYDNSMNILESSELNPECARLPKILHPEWVGPNTDKEECTQLVNARRRLGLRFFPEPQTSLPPEYNELTTTQ